MKKFHEYLAEEILPFAQTEKGFVGIDNEPVRDNINLLLAAATKMPCPTPYHALESIRKILMSYHIALPATNFLDGDAGQEVFVIDQFGKKLGAIPTGDVVTQTPSAYSVYFEYALNERGSFDIFCEIVDEDELEEILDDIDAEASEPEEDAADTYDEYVADNMTEGTVQKQKSDFRSPKYKYAMKAKHQGPGKFVAGTYRTGTQSYDDKDETKVSHSQARKMTKRYRSASDEDKGKLWNKFWKSGSMDESEQIDEVLDTPAKKQAYQDKANKSFKDNFGKKDAKAGHTVSKRLSGLRMSLKKEEVEQIDELSKSKLGQYIKKASHDVATKSAAVGRYADRANKARDKMKKGDYSDWKQGKKDDEFADKMFKKSWKRREGIAKATDKLTK